jgi:DNA-binding NtrC family response regulator
MRKRIAIVDDDDISRRGFAELLADRPELEIVGMLSHTESLRWDDAEWSSVDIAIVDAADEREVADHFPGVGVVEAIRSFRSAEQTMVIVVTGHFFDDAVRTRMREAGADFFYHRSQFCDVERLYRVLLHPELERAAVPPPQDPEYMFRAGVTPATRINDAIRLARELEVPLESGSGPVRKSRAWFRYRAKFNEVARLNPVNADGTVPDREQREPSLPQIERFLQWATRSKSERP